MGSSQPGAVFTGLLGVLFVWRRWSLLLVPDVGFVADKEGRCVDGGPGGESAAEPVFGYVMLCYVTCFRLCPASRRAFGALEA